MNLFEKNVQEKGYTNIETAVQGNTEFALALYQKLRTEDGNLFFSPYSISTTLAMTYAGARGNTEVQMAQALHFLLAQEQLHPAFALLEAKLGNIERKGHIQLKVANTLWPQKGYVLMAEFLALMEQYYGVLITAVDYRDTETARCTINNWVEEKTERKIQELLQPGILNNLTRLVLVNAIYFKGNWASQFDQSLTHDALFWVTPTEQVQVSMMSKVYEFRYGENDGLQILELPYVEGDLSMVVLLPREIDGLTALEEHLTVVNLTRWTRNLQSRKVQVFLPRFEIAFPFRLDNTLRAMGMPDAFSLPDADFSGMDGTKLLFIAAVLHTAFIAVNEEGTEAAASTAAVIMLRSVPPPTPVFHADHPFVFLIRENSTGSILLLGRVLNPG